jgi:diguanylate cyclase (GGDEF)-like protein/PAS domain S-box-containing protein
MSSPPATAASKQLLASILRSSGDAVIDRTPEGVITSWSRGAERLYGYSAEEAVGQPSTILLPPHCLDEEKQILDRAMEGQSIDCYEAERVRRGGGPMTVSMTVSPIWDGPEHIVVGVSTIEREAGSASADRAAPEGDAYLEGAFDDAPIGIALVSVAPGRPGRCLKVNRALCELTGYSPSQLEATGFETIAHPEDQARELTAMAELVAGETAGYELEERLVHSGGHSIWVMVNASLARDEAGRPLYCIRQIQGIDDRKRFEGQLEHLADHDPLTGLLNRRRFVRELSHQMAVARRYGTSGAVLFLDIDDFKFVNDTLGHNIGDEVITAVSSLIHERVRETDVAARLGGDEFAVLLPRATKQEAEALARSLVEEVRRGSVVVLGEERPRVTVSIGITVFDRPDDKMTADDVLVDADLAMYAAKEGGRDRVAFSSSDDLTRMKSRVTWTDRLREALDKDLFELHSQPILDLRRGEVSQHELLLRLRGEEDELIQPATFLYTAERFGLILDIDRWVLGEAMNLIATKQDAGQDLRLEVNISGPSISDPELPGFIEQQLKTTGIEPANLILEVTETAAIANMDQARKFAAGLSDIGCGFALDDFGAGFGSFYYLKYMSFDYVKIDGEFIRNLPASGTDQLILDSIVQMSKGLGKQTIAEFVGSQETVELLRDHGVDYAQGYHLGRPAPLAETLAA